MNKQQSNRKDRKDAWGRDEGSKTEKGKISLYDENFQDTKKRDVKKEIIGNQNSWALSNSHLNQFYVIHKTAKI